MQLGATLGARTPLGVSGAFSLGEYNRYMELVVKDLEEFTAFAAGFIKTIVPRETGATLVTLSGELGAGKTVFVKVVAQTLGVTETVTSPTFVLEKIYPLSGGAFKNLIHIDAYRFEDSAEISALNFEELMKDSGNLVVLEWPERVKNALPKAHVTITLEALPDGSRKIAYV